MKKLISIILAMIIACGCMSVAFAQSGDDRTVVFSEYCGDGENIEDASITVYDDGEAIISGNGAAFFISSLVSQNDIWSLRVEEGITELSIPGYYGDAEASRNITRIILPKSLKKLSGRFIDGSSEQHLSRNKAAVCYAGSSEEWNQIISEHDCDRCFSKYRSVLFFNGEIPNAFCKFDSEDDSLTPKLFIRDYAYVNYYAGGHKDAYLRYRFEKGWFETAQTHYMLSLDSRFEYYPRTKTKTVLTVELVDGNEKVLASDTINVEVQDTDWNVVANSVNLFFADFYLGIPFFMVFIMPALIASIVLSPVDMAVGIYKYLKEVFGAISLPF